MFTFRYTPLDTHTLSISLYLAHMIGGLSFQGALRAAESPPTYEPTHLPTYATPINKIHSPTRMDVWIKNLNKPTLLDLLPF